LGASTVTDGQLWVFGYGSLLWDAGFEPAERVRARLDGYRRSFCMWSTRYRGSEARPGLVLALDAEEGVSCEGLALRAHPEEREAVLTRLRERELVTGAYEERQVTLALADGREVPALAYVVRRNHEQYACVDLETQARTIAGARGMRGANIDYLENTARSLESLGIHDAELEELHRRARALRP
jgi:cation transport protein ChaC